MRQIVIIARKELLSYLASPMAYVVTAVFLALSGTFFVAYLAGSGYRDTSIRGFLSAAQFLLLLFGVLLTMRLIAEEKRQSTWEFLLTAPLRDSEIILGKFLGSMFMLAGMLALTLFYPLILLALGDPDVGPMATSYVGLLLLGSVCLAAGLFASSVTPNQIVAAVVGGGVLFGLWFLARIGTLVPEPLGEVLALLSLSSYFPDFIRGVIDTKAIVYYVSVTALFLYLAIRSIESGRWR
jgi:ABC-2 type transport system permease protein